jgi:hypothetical protein
MMMMIMMTMLMIIFWGFMPFTFAGRCQRFEKNILSHYSGLKIETACLSETLASTYESTWYQNPEEHCHQKI